MTAEHDSGAQVQGLIWAYMTTDYKWDWFFALAILPNTQFLTACYAEIHCEVKAISLR